VAIALIPLINLFITSFRMNRAGYYYLQANLCAQDILQIINERKLQLFDNVPASLSSDSLNYKFSNTFSKYNPSAFISLSESDLPGLFQIDIIVNWIERGKKHSSTTHALIAENSSYLFSLGKK